jgi:alpha-methylacyl-CoA racemase
MTGTTTPGAASASAVPAGRPLEGVRVLVLGGIGPVPFAAMVLSDMGASVTRLERPGGVPITEYRSHVILGRGQKTLTVNLKDPDRVAAIRRDFGQTDIVLEGFRPGVVERLGLGPEEAFAANPGIVYGRMTGWGQSGPLSHKAGHDINYLAVSGALEPIAGSDGTPVPPLNLLGDFGGGAMYLVAGVLAALVDARSTGNGRVVDAAIVDGAANMTAMLHSMRATGDWDHGRGENVLDGGAPYYRCYATADGGWMAVGALEPSFYAALLKGLGLADELSGVVQTDESAWPSVAARFAEVFAQKTREEWVEAFADLDACVSPVVAPGEVLENPHLAERGVYGEGRGYIEPAPAPRFQDAPAAASASAPAADRPLNLVPQPQ